MTDRFFLFTIVAYTDLTFIDKTCIFLAKITRQRDVLIVSTVDRISKDVTLVNCEETLD
jgi:hypothetical protein